MAPVAPAPPPSSVVSVVPATPPIREPDTPAMLVLLEDQEAEHQAHAAAMKEREESSSQYGGLFDYMDTGNVSEHPFM